VSGIALFFSKGGFGLNSKISEDELKLAVEQMREGIQIIDSEWRYKYLNQAAALQGRKQKEDFVGRTMMECYPGIETTAMFKDLEQVVRTGQPTRRENEFEFEDNQKCWFELFVEPYAGGVLIRSFDITERKKLEEQLRHSQKLEAIGSLAGGIAHDFNNKLAVIMACGEMIRAHLSGRDSVVDGYVARILQAVDQSASLTRQLLAFSRKQVLDLHVINLNMILAESRTTLPKLLGEKITIRYALAEDLENVRVDASQMDQVILNLTINARDAMPDGGVLTIETANAFLDEEYARTHPDVAMGRYVMLSISDTGIGMDAATQSKIFEPFFTTKNRAEGTGLGLSMVYGIINQCRGHIWVYSETGMGSVFKIYLPGVSETAEDISRARVSDLECIECTGHETVLIVEDDAILREAFAIALGNVGYIPLVAKDPQEAERLFTESLDRIDLLLTDIVLPGMNGWQLYERLKEHKSGLNVVFMSGYAENAIVKEGVLEGDFVLLQKPISMRRLLETIRKVLDGKLKRGVA
jgi:two-component system cell cycle sensor histidine kinase/response regulator CckA